MEYIKRDIPKIPITRFMDALGKRPIKELDDLKLYYSPYRDDREPKLVVHTKLNRWYDLETDKNGNLRDLAKLTAGKNKRKDIDCYILESMNTYESTKWLLDMSRRPREQIIIKLDIDNLPLVDFMKAIGQKEPVAADGCLRIYKAPYDKNREPTMVINIETNQWRDTKSGAYGGIYDLAYELTGSCSMSDLNRYIARQMEGFSEEKTAETHETFKQEPMSQELEKPKRGIHL